MTKRKMPVLTLRQQIEALYRALVFVESCEEDNPKFAREQAAALLRELKALRLAR